MWKEINQKLNNLNSRRPYDHKIQAQINELNMLDMIYGSMRLDGSPLKKEHVWDIMKGKIVTEAALDDYGLVERYSSMIKKMKSMMDMQTELNEKVIVELMMELNEGEAPLYRQASEIVYAFDYQPPNPLGTKEKLRGLFLNLYSDNDFGMILQGQPHKEEADTPLKRAVMLHNKFVAIYPFEEGSETMARTIMYYHLMQHGYPTFTLGFSETEYNTAIYEYLSTGNSIKLYATAERSLYNKLEVLLQVTEV